MPALSLRGRGIALLVALILELLLGLRLAAVGSPYPLVYLASHVVLAVLLVGFSAYAAVIAFRDFGVGPRAAALVAFVGSAGAAAAGTAFLELGSSPGLYAMEVLGVVAILGAALLIALGGVRPGALTSPTVAT